MNKTYYVVLVSKTGKRATIVNSTQTELRAGLENEGWKLSHVEDEYRAASDYVSRFNRR